MCRCRVGNALVLFYCNNAVNKETGEKDYKESIPNLVTRRYVA